MAIAFAAVVLSLSVIATEALAQTRSNAQQEQAQALRNRGGLSLPSTPPVGRYVAESGDAFTLDRSGRYPLLRFDRREETLVLRPSPAPRGDVIYRNDTGEQVLRVTSSGGMTVFTPRAPGGSPVSLSGSSRSLEPPVLGPIRLWSLMARRSEMISQALGRLVTIHLTGDRSEALCVEALIVTTDAVIRIARSPTANEHLGRLRSISITEGSRASVTYANGRLSVVVNPDEGMAGRPSSARVIQTILPRS